MGTPSSPMRIAVLGATGFLGRHVVRRLLEDGYRVHSVARRLPSQTHPSLTGTTLDVTHASFEEAAQAIRGCDALVNLIGIKREKGDVTFEAVHVGVVRTLIDAARREGVRRLVHISVVVSRPDGVSGYHDTKWRAEQQIKASGLDWTILRPGVIYGEGDDMLSHLAKMVHAAPVFPIVGNGSTLMQPVAVKDVAISVSKALSTAASVGQSYDVVGPRPLPLREIVGCIASAMGLPLQILSTPRPLMRIAVKAMNVVMREPLSTPAQLRMLEEGMTGDPAAMQRELGVEPCPFSAEGIRPTLQAYTGRLPIHLRPSERWKDTASLSLSWLAILAVLSVVVMSAPFVLTVSDTWTRLISCTSVLGVIALVVHRRRREPGSSIALALSIGVAAGLVLFGVAKGVAAFGPVATRAAEMYQWNSGHGVAFLLPTLVLAVVGEELFWRGLLLRGFATRMPGWLAVLLAALICAVAHSASGSILLVLAAFGMSIAWGGLYLATRSLAAPLACHLLWDVLALLVLPLAR